MQVLVNGFLMKPQVCDTLLVSRYWNNRHKTGFAGFDTSFMQSILDLMLAGV